MEIVRMPEGTIPDVDTDCITIERRPDGRFDLSGSVLSGEESVALAVTTHDEFYAAMEAGLAWAAGHDVARLHVTTTAYEPETGDTVVRADAGREP